MCSQVNSFQHQRFSLRIQVSYELLLRITLKLGYWDSLPILLQLWGTSAFHLSFPESYFCYLQQSSFVTRHLSSSYTSCAWESQAFRIYSWLAVNVET